MELQETLLNLYKLILLLDYTTTEPTNAQSDTNNDQPVVNSTIDKSTVVLGKLMLPHTQSNLVYIQCYL